MLKVTVRSRCDLLFEQEVQTVRLPAAGGEFEVMAYHIPFVTSLRAGRLWLDGRVLQIRGGAAWMGLTRLVALVEAG